MTAKKNPFAEYQAEKTRAREELITRFLGSLRRTRAKYEYVTDLAKAVAEQIAMSERLPCSTSTVLRNKRYKALLLNFMASQSGVAGATAVTESVVQMRVTVAELEAGNFKRENERLHKYIQDLERRLDTKTSLTLPAPGNVQQEDELAALTIKHALTCKALWQVVNHFSDLASLDIDGQRIIDLTAPKKNNVIAGHDELTGFLEWLQANRVVG